MTKYVSLVAAIAALAACPAWAVTVNGYSQTNLVSDIPGLAAKTDPNLVNPWGIAESGGSPFWVSDNGSGKPDGVFAQPKTGLGTGVVKALAKQLDAQVVTMSGALGTKVSVTHATFAAA